MAIISAFRVAQRCVYNGHTVTFNVFHLFSQSEERFAAEVAVDWRDNIVPTWKSNVTTWHRFDNVLVTKVFPYTGDAAAVALTGTGAMAPSRTTDPIYIPAPAAIAGVLTWRSSRPGRSFRGRSFIAGMPMSINDGGRWHADDLLRLGNIGTVIKNRYELGGNPYSLELGVLSRVYTAAQPAADPPAIWKVIAFTAQTYYATMGSRRAGRGL